MRIRPTLTGALTLALLTALALVIMLSRRVDALSREYVRVRTLASTLHSGSVVPGFRATSLTGDSLLIGEGPDPDTRQVLFILTTTCPHCLATLPAWARIADSLARQGSPKVQAIALSLDPEDATRRYAEEHRIGYPVALFPNAKMKRLYRAGIVPTTVVLDHEGRVLYARAGRLEEPALLDSIHLAARLPRRSSSVAPGSSAIPVSRR
ncbi:MAG: peroxiredoxin family protein [Gemmatimonadales bacterium]